MGVKLNDIEYQKKEKFDESGLSAISNFSIQGGYNHLKPSIRFLYIGLQSLAHLNGEIPSSDLINYTQYQIYNVLQLPKSTFSEYLKILKNAKLIKTDPKDNRKIRLLHPEQKEIDKVFDYKLNLIKQKNKFMGFTLVPNSLLYAFPELSPGAKYLYILIKSLCWLSRKMTWHKILKLTEISGIKYRTLRKYLRDLRNFNLSFTKKKFGVNKSNIAIMYNKPSTKEQERSSWFISTFLKKIKDKFLSAKQYMTDRKAINLQFEDYYAVKLS